MRRNGRRHADRNALRAVGQQVRKRRGQHERFLCNAVVAWPEIDGVFVDAVEEEPRDLRQARLGIAIGRGVIAVDIAEIALPVDQRIARGKVLRQPHQRIVDRLVAMRMEIAHHVADDLRRLLKRRAGIEAQQPHAVEDAPVHGFEPVARVGQRAMHDGGQRISEIALFQRLAQRNFLDAARFGGNHFLIHGLRALPLLRRLNKGGERGDEAGADLRHG